MSFGNTFSLYIKNECKGEGTGEKMSFEIHVELIRSLWLNEKSKLCLEFLRPPTKRRPSRTPNVPCNLTISDRQSLPVCSHRYHACIVTCVCVLCTRPRVVSSPNTPTCKITFRADHDNAFFVINHFAVYPWNIYVTVKATSMRRTSACDPLDIFNASCDFWWRSHVYARCFSWTTASLTYVIDECK